MRESSDPFIVDPPILELLQPRPPGDQRHRDAVGEAHLRPQPRSRIGVAEGLHVGLAASDLHRPHVGGRETVLGSHAQHHVEDAVQPAAGGVGLDAAAHDAVRAGEVAGQLLGPLAAVAVGGEKAAPGRVEHPGRTGETGPGHVRRGDPDLGRPAGVVALAHGAVGDIGPDAAGEAAGNAERPGGALGVEAEQAGGRRGGSEAAAGAGRMPAAAVVVRPVAAHGVEDAERDVVPADHRRQHCTAVGDALRLRDGQHGGDDDGPRMVRASEVVELLGMRDDAVNQRGRRGGGRSGGAPDAARPRGRRETFRRLQHGPGFLGVDAGQRRAQQIEHQHAGVADDVVRHLGEVEARGEAGQHLARARVRLGVSRRVVHCASTLVRFKMKNTVYSFDK